MLEPLNSDFTTGCEVGDCGPSGAEVCDDAADARKNQADAVIIPFSRRKETVEMSLTGDVSQAVEFFKAAEARLKASKAVFASIDKQFLLEAAMKMGVSLEDIIEEIASVEGIIGEIGTIQR